jgi:uncharacterized protein YjbJ (UPF0337 family)
MEKIEVWTKIAGAWSQTKGEVRKQWGKLTDNDLEHINGQRDVLLGKLQRIYGLSRDKANCQIDEWEQRLKW